MRSQSIHQQLAEARIAIENTLANPKIEKQLAQVGYNRKKVLEGKSLYANALQLHQEYEEKYSKQYGATNIFYQDLQAANILYRRHRKLAKIAHENNTEQLTALKLHLPISKSIEKWLLHANTFYKLLAQDSSVMQQYGVFTEELAQAQAMIDALLEARNRQVSKKGEAQHATRQRNKSLEALHVWMKDFRLAARYALRENVQLLEVLGMPVAAERL